MATLQLLNGMLTARHNSDDRITLLQGLVEDSKGGEELVIDLITLAMSLTDVIHGMDHILEIAVPGWDLTEMVREMAIRGELGGQG